MLKSNQGLDRFIREFSVYKDAFVIIGGLASTLNMSIFNLEFRVTKDYDLVVLVKDGNESFFYALRAFLRDGGYSYGKKGNYYRFTNPKDSSYPFMIEILSRVDLELSRSNPIHKFRIKINEDVFSLSAIMLDEDIYKLVLYRQLEIMGLHIVDPYALIAMKVRAWRDLTEKKNKGENINSDEINKHRKDVIRLSQIIDDTQIIDLGQQLKEDILYYLDACELDDHSFHQIAPNLESFGSLRKILIKVFQL
jgi:hypothetical protein